MCWRPFAPGYLMLWFRLAFRVSSFRLAFRKGLKSPKLNEARPDYMQGNTGPVCCAIQVRPRSIETFRAALLAVDEAMASYIQYHQQYYHYLDNPLAILYGRKIKERLAHLTHVWAVAKKYARNVFRGIPCPDIHMAQLAFDAFDSAHIRSCFMRVSSDVLDSLLADNYKGCPKKLSILCELRGRYQI